MPPTYRVDDTPSELIKSAQLYVSAPALNAIDASKAEPPNVPTMSLAGTQDQYAAKSQGPVLRFGLHCTFTLR